MGVSEVAAQGGGPMSVPGSEVIAPYPQGNENIMKQRDSGAPVTGDGKGSPTADGMGPMSVPMDTSSQGSHQTGDGKGSPGGDGGPMSVPMNTTDTPSPPDTSR